MTVPLARYLGRPVDELLHVEPFSKWRFVRSVEHEPSTEISYEFDSHGVDVTCDEFECIKAMFLRNGAGESLAGLSFSACRREVLRRFGIPEKSGSPHQIPGLGACGAWDRFRFASGTLHVEYRVEGDEIAMITLIRADSIPI